MQPPAVPPFGISKQTTEFQAVLTRWHHGIVTECPAFNVNCRICYRNLCPPDPELVDLIEQVFLEGQIDGLNADLAYLWL